jgi:DNA polymerase I-like protein with 3'-5' exonuclease and polymerase domains
MNDEIEFIDKAYQPIKQVYFNPGSRNHCRKWLSERGWIPEQFTSKGNAVFNAEVMAKSTLPECQLLKEYFKYAKDYGQLANGKNSIIKNLRSDNTISHNCISIGANTGRMSHSSPNLGQSISTEEYRELFIAPKGFKVVGADMEAQELRVLAHLLYPYDNGIYAKMVLDGKKEDKTDIHSVNQRIAKLDSRDQAKTMIYAILYGASVIKIGYSIAPDDLVLKDISVVEDDIVRNRKIARRTKLIEGNRYFPIDENTYIPVNESLIHKGVYGLRTVKLFEARTIGYRRLLEDLKAEVEDRNNFIIGIDGRYLNVRSSHSALNLKCQGAAAIITKVWLTKFYNLVAKEKFVFGRDFRPLAVIHDEIQTAVIDKYSETFGEMLKEAATLVQKELNLYVPMEANYKIGDNWWQTH